MADQQKALIGRVALEKPVEVEIAPGSSIAQVIEAANIPEAVMPHIVTMLNGVEVTDWDNVWLEDDDKLAILIMPAGGGAKDVLRLVAVIAVAVAAPHLAAAMGLSGTAATVATAGITLVGTMAVSALIPPAAPSLAGGASSADPTFWFTGSQNQMKPYQKVPIVYGSVRMYAAAVSQPIIFNAGKMSEFTGLYDFGLGSVNVFDVKIGDTPIHALRGEHVKHEQEPKLINNANPALGYKPVPLKLMNLPSASAPLTVGLNDKDQQGVATTRPDTQVARIELAFPAGLVRFKDNGDEERRGVEYKVEIKRASEPNSDYRVPPHMIGYGGEDHITFSGIASGDPDKPASYPRGDVILDPDGTAPRDANNNIVLGAGDRLTVRFEFDRAVYQFRPTDVNTDPVSAMSSLVFDTTPVNPNGYTVVSGGGASDGIMVVDGETDGSVRIVELEYTPVAGKQIIAVQMATNFANLYDGPPPGGKPFDAYRIKSAETFAINSVGGTVPPPNTNPDTPTTDDTEFYEDRVTYIYYIEYKVKGLAAYLIEDGSAKLFVKGVQKPISLESAYLARGTVMKKKEMLGFGGDDYRYECWAAVKRDYV